jgi:hypothetical protein
MLSSIGLAQSGILHGHIISAEDQSPLPFVHIRFDSGTNGTTSNIDGNFTLPNTVKKLEFSYIGFNPLTLVIGKLQEDNLVIQMTPDNKLLSTIEVHPGRNPAYRIMQTVLEHITENDPDNLESYQYTSYHKFWLTADVPSEDQLNGKIKITPSELAKIQQRFESNHMLLTETMSRKKFLQPNHENEEILSSKVSGLKKTNFFMLSNQLQSFSIYRENFALLSKNYLSPVSKTALKNYAFILEDTLQINNLDTIFLIRFHPAKDRNFDGLKGFLHINTHGYAVQSVIAEPANTEKKDIYATIWQSYGLLESGHWFPSELNASINVKMTTSVPTDTLTKKKKPIELSITANSRTYIYQSEVNLPLDPKSFPKYGMTVSPENRDSLMDANGVRYIPLTAKDSTTYQYLDSLGNKVHLNQKMKLLHALSLGTFPIGPVSINFMYLFGYNINEGYKIGLGLETNKKFSKYYALGTYFTYGTKDGAFRHGEWLRIYPTGYPDVKIELSYKNIKKEYGVEEMLTDFDIFEPEYFRSLLIENMYLTKNFTASAEMRPIQPLNVKLFVDQASNHRLSYGNFTVPKWDPFQLTRVGLELRYSPGIAFLNDPDELIQSAPPKSDLFFTLIQGLNLLNSDYHYTKIDTKAKFRIRLSAMSTTYFMIRAGKIFNPAPITDWFHGYGSYSGDFTLLAPYSFATMRLNEYSADQYAALHIRHNFGSGFIPSWYFIRPELALAQSIGFGSLKQQYTDESGAKDFRKGYYESGIELNRILNTNFMGFGFGTYYRYGPYRINIAAQNFAYKFTINFKF